MMGNVNASSLGKAVFCGLKMSSELSTLNYNYSPGQVAQCSANLFLFGDGNKSLYG